MSFKLKQIIRYLLTRVNCLLFSIRYKKGLYIGFGCKLVGGKHRVILNNFCEIMPHSMIVAHPTGKVEIGAGSTVSMYSRIASRGFVKLGEDIEMGPGCFIADYNHDYRNPSVPIKRQGNIFYKKEGLTPNVYIGDGSWLGTNVVIVGNINIGKHCVIGANSVVTKDIPDFCIVAGAPAKIIKKYDFDKKEWIKTNV